MVSSFICFSFLVAMRMGLEDRRELSFHEGSVNLIVNIVIGPFRVVRELSQLGNNKANRSLKELEDEVSTRANDRTKLIVFKGGDHCNKGVTIP